MIAKATIKNQDMERYVSATVIIVSYGILLLGIVTVSLAIASIVYLGWL